MKTKFTKGEIVAVVLPSKLPKPMIGTILTITAEVGKSIGVLFETYVGGHSCDGRGEEGKCLWLHPSNVFETTDLENLEPTPVEKTPEFQSLEIDPVTRKLKVS